MTVTGLAAVLVAACLVTGLPGSGSLAAEQPAESTQPSDAERLFTLDVLPLLKEKCLGCHGDEPDDLRGDFDVRSRASLLRGGESEEASIVPGKPEESSLYRAVLWEDYEMPPKENDRLTEAQTEVIRSWIEAGAPWPDEQAQQLIQRQEWAVIKNDDGLIIPTSGGTADAWTYRRYQPDDVWAFQPLPSRQQLIESLPAGDGHDQNVIDTLIRTRLEDAGLEPASQADPATLIRRASFDLTGLPPDPQDVGAFVTAWQDDAERAWSELIDRLLESPHYGERWAQHWLDVVRYSDTGGFSNDYERSNAWRYRDYVIRTFSEDRPFNEFVVEQIAGDELRPNDPEAVIATGFLRMGPWGTAMIPKEEARQIYLDDLVHNTGQAFLSMPMRCCKCHDHKFDPIPTRDYYRMYAAFATTQPAEVTAEFLADENRNRFDQQRRLVKELLDYARLELKQIDDKQERAARQWYDEHGLPYKNENARKGDPEDMKPPRHVGLDPEEKGLKKVREQDVWIWERRLERFEPMAQGVYNGPDKNANARKLRTEKNIDTDWRPETFIYAGGSIDAKTDPVKPGVLSATGLPAESAADDPYRVTDDLARRRLELARWIASDENPLTARSIVNRVWQSHFGKGIVNTPNNFGAKGGKPTHPKLLDYLTIDFIEHGWKLKRLHRQIMMSEAYQRSGTYPDLEKLDSTDPQGELLARFPARRLSAEEYRDSVLTVSGELNREVGGLPIMPEINMGVALQPRMIQFSIAPAHQPSPTPAERNRRTIYAYRVRGQADPMLEILNQPNPNESCERRDSAAVTPQAFTLLNSDVMTDRSLATALRVQAEFESRPESQVRRAVQLALGRDPTPAEQRSLESYLVEMVSYHQQVQPDEVPYPTEVVRSLVEEFTGEPFEFVELLNVYNDYTPDAKPWTVSAETRALADVCLLLFNTNEFMYVY